MSNPITAVGEGAHDLTHALADRLQRDLHDVLTRRIGFPRHDRNGFLTGRGDDFMVIQILPRNLRSDAVERVSWLYVDWVAAPEDGPDDERRRAPARGDGPEGAGIAENGARAEDGQGAHAPGAVRARERVVVGTGQLVIEPRKSPQVIIQAVAICDLERRPDLRRDAEHDRGRDDRHGLMRALRSSGFGPLPPKDHGQGDALLDPRACDRLLWRAGAEVVGGRTDVYRIQDLTEDEFAALVCAFNGSGHEHCSVHEPKREARRRAGRKARDEREAHDKAGVPIKRPRDDEEAGGAPGDAGSDARPDTQGAVRPVARPAQTTAA